ncbi:hypothetical protein C5167_015389, partial [Papaver somniferum]
RFAFKMEGWSLIVVRLRFGSREGKAGMAWLRRVKGFGVGPNVTMRRFGDLGRLRFAFKMEGWSLIVTRLRFGSREGKAGMASLRRDMPLAHVACREGKAGMAWLRSGKVADAACHWYMWHGRHALACLGAAKLGFWRWAKGATKLGFWRWAKGYHALVGDLGRLRFASKMEGWPLIVARLRFGSREGKAGMVAGAAKLGFWRWAKSYHALVGDLGWLRFASKMEGWSLIVARLRFGSREGKAGMAWLRRVKVAGATFYWNMWCGWHGWNALARRRGWHGLPLARWCGWHGWHALTRRRGWQGFDFSIQVPKHLR